MNDKDIKMIRCLSLTLQIIQRITKFIFDLIILTFAFYGMYYAYKINAVYELNQISIVVFVCAVIIYVIKIFINLCDHIVYKKDYCESIEESKEDNITDQLGDGM